MMMSVLVLSAATAFAASQNYQFYGIRYNQGRAYTGKGWVKKANTSKKWQNTVTSRDTNYNPVAKIANTSWTVVDNTIYGSGQKPFFENKNKKGANFGLCIRLDDREKGAYDLIGFWPPDT